MNNKTNITEISSEFKTHFDTLLNTPRTEPINNTQSNLLLEDLLADLNGTENDFTVNEEDVHKAINSLNKEKADDPFGIKAEHFVYAFDTPSSPNLTNLTRIINQIFQGNQFPELLSTSHIVPIIKSYKKPINDPNNYRGISLIPILTKLIEKIILLKCPQLKHHDDNQFGFSSDGSTLHAEFLINETIRKYNSKHTPVYVCSLDAEKAFDSCNWHQLFVKLRSKGILPNSILRFLIGLYQHGDAKIKYQNTTSSAFLLSQGVRQGSILSPYLYNIYTEDILKEIRDLNIGTFLDPGINTSIIAFADDLILLSPNLKHLQQMLSLCESYGQATGLKFNSKKTQFVISGDCPFQHPTVIINDKEVKPQPTLKHLGFLWDTKLRKITLAGHQENRISELWAVTFSLIASGIRKMHPNIIANIFRSIVLPKVLYGMELTVTSKPFLERLNRQCRSAFKNLLGYSKFGANDLNKLYKLADITPFIENRKISLLAQLMKNRQTSQYFLHILACRDRQYSIIPSIMQICARENINIVELVLYFQKPFKVSNRGDLIIDGMELDLVERLRTLIANWDVYDCRVEMRDIINRNIKT